MRPQLNYILILASLTVAAPLAAAASVGSGGKSWQLDIALHDPQRITLRLPGQEREITYWYVLYTVTNNSDREVPFYPTFDIVTDKLTVIEGGADISPTVYDAIKARHRKAYPFFIYASEVFGPLLRGEDHARTSAVAFRRPDPSVNHFTLLIGGLSGEIVKRRNQAFDPAKEESRDNPRHFLLRKTLAVSYDVPGDERTRLSATPARVKEEWVMR